MTDIVDDRQHFEALFDQHADPWGTRTRWYEARKRALTLAMLPQARVARACEPGCGAGELSAALAERCDALLATDASAAAVGRARTRLAGRTNARVEHARMPQDWPAGPFDLVVVSELGYYLSIGELHTLAAAIRASLAPGATLVACHWRRYADDLRHSAEDVHAVLGAAGGLATLASYVDEDFLLQAWSPDARSVARREGLA
jgi:predicted TPR repeat methyltransferase